MTNARISRTTESMERQRDLQTELGAMLDRFCLAGLFPREILEVLSAEGEIWEHRDSRDKSDPLQKMPTDPHRRPHPPVGGMASHPLLGSPGSEPANT